MAGKGTDNKHTLAGLAFAELVIFIEEDHMDDVSGTVIQVKDGTAGCQACWLGAHNQP